MEREMERLSLWIPWEKNPTIIAITLIDRAVVEPGFTSVWNYSNYYFMIAIVLVRKKCDGKCGSCGGCGKYRGLKARNFDQ